MLPSLPKLALLAANPAASTDDIDVAYTQAYGFPRYLVSLFCTAPATRRLLAYLAYEILASYLACRSQHRNVCWAGRTDVVVGETGAAAREGVVLREGRRVELPVCRRGEAHTRPFRGGVARTCKKDFTKTFHF